MKVGVPSLSKLSSSGDIRIGADGAQISGTVAVTTLFLIFGLVELISPGPMPFSWANIVLLILRKQNNNKKRLFLG